MRAPASVVSSVLVATFSIFLLSSAAFAGPTEITDRSSLKANDFIDWSQLGEAVNFVPSGSAVTSDLGLTGSISNTSTSVEHAFRRVDQGVGGWLGNFQDLTALLFTNYTVGPIVIDFDTPVFGAGAQIQSHVGTGTSTSSVFTAYLQVYGADDTTLLATFSVQGLSNNYADDSAVFLGALDTEAEIGKIEYLIAMDRPLDRSFAINYLSVKSPTRSLTVTKSGTGTITASRPGIDCGSTCNASYASGARVSLTATADAGSYFAGWGPPCSGYSLCTFTLSADTQVNATFSPGHFDTVQRAYIGYYQRAGDPGGLIYWAGRVGLSAGSLTDIIEAFANSAESRALYEEINSGNIETVVRGIYRALFNRDAETEGRDYYVNGYNTGRFTAATIMLDILYGAQNEDMHTLSNKLAAANLFTRTIDAEFDGVNCQVTYAGDDDAVKGRSFLASVTDDPATVPTQDQATTYMRANIADVGDPIMNP